MNVLKTEKRSVFSPGEDGFSGRKGRDLLSCACFYSSVAAIFIIFISPPFCCRAIYTANFSSRSSIVYPNLDPQTVRSTRRSFRRYLCHGGFIFLPYYGAFGFYCFDARSRRECDTRSPRKARTSGRYGSDQSGL